MRKVKIAQIGTNRTSHGIMTFDSLCKQSEVFDLTAVAFPERERERFPEIVERMSAVPEKSVEEILSDPTVEAVAVETEEPYLTKYALMAIRAGKHVHMEKPGGFDLAAFEELIAAVKASGKVFHTGYMYRYNPVIQEVFRRAKAGEFGEIVSVEAQMNCRHDEATRRWLETVPGGMMFFLGCHLIDLALQLQGEPQEILPMNRVTGCEGVGCEDFGMAILRYPRGNTLIKTYDYERGGFLRRQLVLTGTKATVEIKPIEWYREGGQYTDWRLYTVDSWLDAGESFSVGPYDRYDGMMRAFAEYITGEAKNPYSPDWELTLYRTLLRCCGR